MRSMLPPRPKAAACLLAAALPGLAAAQSAPSVWGFLGMPTPETRAPQAAFVLPATHPERRSEAAPGARASANLFAMPGTIDMPTATAFPDGELTLSAGGFAGIWRTTLSFQLTPRITGAFRYNRFRDLNFAGFDDYYDRAFDIQYLIAPEQGWRPALAVGLRDLAGTGIDAGEYIVATKTLTPAQGQFAGQRFTVSAGLGWGRLGSAGAIGSPFSADRPSFVSGDTGGEFSVDQWFRGPAAPFASVTWQPDARWRVHAEYSSDAYELETRQGLFERKSPFNFGLEYQAADAVRLGLYAMHGSEIGARVHIALNPRRTETQLAVAGPGPVARRPDPAAFPALWTTEWRAVPGTQAALAARLAAELEPQGLTVTGLTLAGATEAVLRIENGGYGTTAMAVGRAARAMALVLPPSVERFRILLADKGLDLTEVRLRRADFERLEAAPDRAAALASLTTVAAPRSSLGGSLGSSFGAAVAPLPGLYPRTSFKIRPYVGLSFFDPQNPLRADLGIAATGRLELSPGLAIDGVLRQKLVGNVGDDEPSTSLLEPVRTNSKLYSNEDDVTLQKLTLSYAGALGNDLYGRATVGYLERMFGGVSGEILWKPPTSQLALGVELNYVRQRDFDQRFGFQDYGVLTGHVSAYYDFRNGYHGQLDIGRYLAGDIGATITLDREFANGWRVGAFASFTNVSAEEFGEGSFDKGIRLTIPLQAVSGRPSPDSFTRALRPLRRDGGARLRVDGRLYERVRKGGDAAVFADWSRVWR